MSHLSPSCQSSHSHLTAIDLFAGIGFARAASWKGPYGRPFNDNAPLWDINDTAAFVEDPWVRRTAPPPPPAAPPSPPLPPRANPTDSTAPRFNELNTLHQDDPSSVATHDLRLDTGTKRRLRLDPGAPKRDISAPLGLPNPTDSAAPGLNELATLHRDSTSSAATLDLRPNTGTTRRLRLDLGAAARRKPHKRPRLPRPTSPTATAPAAPPRGRQHAGMDPKRTRSPSMDAEADLTARSRRKRRPEH